MIILRDDNKKEYLFLVYIIFCDKYVEDETKSNLKEVGDKDEVIEIPNVAWDYVIDSKEINGKLYSLKFLDNYKKKSSEIRYLIKIDFFFL